MPKYAKGGKAFGFCDRCGFRYPLEDLVEQYIDDYRSNLLVCRDSCLDIDHEQLRTEYVQADDPIGLKDPRPDLTQDEGREFFGWNPTASFKMRMKLGAVTVSTS